MDLIRRATDATFGSGSSRSSRGSRSSRHQKNQSPPPVGRMQSGFKSEAESNSSRSSTKTKLVQDTFPVYNLRWALLKGFLEERFPDYVFEERKVNRDYYQFDVPEKLSAEERNEILKLKDKKEIVRGQSPERSASGTQTGQI